MKKNPLIVALDLEDKQKAIDLVKELKDSVSIYKIGPVMFTRYGAEIVKAVTDLGKEVFLDLKLHDIPNTVVGAAREIAALNVSLFTVHTTGGREMLQQTAKLIRKCGRKRPKVIGVTILTSISEECLHQELNVQIPLLEQVVNLAKLAQEAGLDGIVASPLEVAAIRKLVGRDLLIIAPGIRPAGTAAGDQKRAATPRQAIENGADYLVVGRPITQSKQPRKVVEDILNELKA